MPKKSVRMSGRPSAKRGRWPGGLRAAVAATACLVLAGAAAGLWFPRRRAATPTPAASATAPQANLGLAKEYIYAGGRLVAIEAPGAAGPPPTNLVATAVSSSSVSLSWSPPPSGAVTGYVVERAESLAGPFTRLSPDPTSTSFVDTLAANGAAYVYHVRAVFAGGGSSDFGNLDLATTYAFSDNPLIPVGDPQGRPATSVKAAHLTELREAVGAVRALAGVGLGTWATNPAPAVGGSIRAAHFLELRDNLNPALAALGLPQLQADPTLAVGLPVRASHLQVVRDKLK